MNKVKNYEDLQEQVEKMEKFSKIFGIIFIIITSVLLFSLGVVIKKNSAQILYTASFLIVTVPAYLSFYIGFKKIDTKSYGWLIKSLLQLRLTYCIAAFLLLTLDLITFSKSINYIAGISVIIFTLILSARCIYKNLNTPLTNKKSNLEKFPEKKKLRFRKAKIEKHIFFYFYSIIYLELLLMAINGFFIFQYDKTFSYQTPYIATFLYISFYLLRCATFSLKRINKIEIKTSRVFCEIVASGFWLAIILPDPFSDFSLITMSVISLLFLSLAVIFKQ